MSFLNNFLVFRQTVFFRSKQTRRTHGEYRSSRLESIKIDKQFRTRPSHLVTIVFRALVFRGFGRFTLSVFLFQPFRCLFKIRYISFYRRRAPIAQRHTRVPKRHFGFQTLSNGNSISTVSFFLFM